MRLTCPKCGAQYEVPDEVIPEGGRDVQCSNCDNTWFQKRAGETAETPPPEASETRPTHVEAQVAAKPPAAKPAPRKPEMAGQAARPGDVAERPRTPPAAERSVDPNVASILREEAAREAELRAREAGNLESQPDLGLEAPASAEPVRKPEQPADERARETRRGALPDIEEINATLRSEVAAEQADRDKQPQRKPDGFMRGFALIVILGVVLILLYSNAQQIGEAVPQADPALASYVALIDQARIWLEAQAAAIMQP
ncbi:hypothetical protein AVO45_11575 [Ruegeria marisrubri]|uniref:Zinc finger/thioredoxin putative domain-containing protein n=1 Tax=Ruegeria marisrubri TaxID=1685379 RepID=A0A0X3TN26_9RHOB|nr:zinc-ribbon domain-containing protein [Ruegeria marisrubri]KUJ76431.1 hypothetical protein AVO45_11575 [Ruegeria marisrubri]